MDGSPIDHTEFLVDGHLQVRALFEFLLGHAT